ncbi:thiamine pyrophosphate-binding protein [Amycolatopsis methanolica]|uniref:Acetolactate synthase I/II/III large subunit n=1 Tax=Amycolatopsis methanolica 239 TaxID=1068978 RepID=A0A076MNK3_AMYME|nr:thiamine pyrophosphate-binding protein [Amycolatopsis methanolica]AIJ22443.1 acetolactate synthase I/II/III large subunit [Amycolatopsis methanolica 239]
MIVAEAVGRVLAELGAGPVFGVVGSGNFHVTNALRAAGVAFHATRHEGGAATAADACARMSGRVALVSTHQGCGLTNAVTGIGEAAKSRTPLIVLTAESPAADPLNNFRIDQDALARAVGAVALRVHSPETAVADTVRAYRTALHERRTVVLNLPLDVQAEPAPPLEAVEPVPAPPAPEPDAASVVELAALLAAAERPVFIAGRGGRGAGAEIRALAEACGALLATSAVAHGLFHGDPWALGISGGFASPLAAELVRDADLVVGWGCALNRWTTRRGKLIGPSARLAQVDLEPSALGAHRPVDVGVVGDAAATARAALAELGDQRKSGYRSPALRDRIVARARWSAADYRDESTADLIDPRTLSAELDRILPAERVVSVDSGNFMGYPSAFLDVPDEFGFCFTQAFQSIGLGLATAIGAAIAQPGRLPVAALGDGGFHMAAQELDTAVRLGLPLLLVVYNDAAYGAEVHHFTGDHTTVRFPPTDIAAIGRGFGCTGVTVRTVADLRQVSEWLAGPREKPLVVDAKITDDGGSWWLAEAFHGH